MLYDNGGLGEPRRTPMAMPTPSYTPKPKLPAPLPQQPLGKIPPPSKLGQFSKQPLDIQKLLQAQGLAGKVPVLRGANRQPTGQPQMPQYPQPMRPLYQYGGAGGMTGAGPSMGYRPINPNQQRDAAGNMPGEWDYRPPQQYGNPFMPMVPY